MVANTSGYFDTANNREAEKGIEGDPVAVNPSESGTSELDFLSLAVNAVAKAESYMSSNLRHRYARSYRAFQNEHYTGSKYLTKRFKGRSRLYRPKTRTSVRKGDATAANALFSTADVVNVSAENDENEQQQASAIINHELLNYRLDRSSKGGIPWFITAVGASQDARITGICVSKQYWKYEEKAHGTETVIDEETGEEVEQPRIKVVKDQPMVHLFAPENVLRDPGSDWIDQAQSSSFLIGKFAMFVGDVKAMMKQPIDKRGTQAWLDVDDAIIRRASVKATEAAAVRRARESTGIDRLDDNHNTVQNFEIVWVHENFIRYDGEDYHFWTIGTHALLTEPTPVEEVYPEQGGARPYVIGYGVLESHKVDPMSPVESWQPLQQESNDITNLHLDGLKQSMNPTTKVKRGKRVDLTQVQNRSPDSVIMLDDVEDVSWDRPPDPSGQTFAMQDRINADFDDLAGSFTGGSVSTNRSLNETVGGMQLLNSSANSVSEFDLRVWIETWVEPVLRQLVLLEQMYETDEVVLALAGSRAKLYQRFGVDEITDDLLIQQVTVRVNVGIGASDPMQKLEKFNMAAKTVADILGPKLQTRIKANEVIEEVFGAAGYKDGARFFRDMDEDEEDPRIQEMEQVIQQLQQELQDKQADRDADMGKEKLKADTSLEKQEQISATRLLEKIMDNQNTENSAARQFAEGQINSAQTHQRTLQTAQPPR